MPAAPDWTREAGPTRGERLISRYDALAVCEPDPEALEILRSTSFRSQSDFRASRGLRLSNLVNDFFDADAFQGKTILELGPGHYAFALVARYLGARVVCVERDPAFVKLGRYLGFEVVDADFNEVTAEMLGRRFDGLFVKGTFNACNYPTDGDVAGFVERLTSLVEPDGWAWCVTVNKAARTPSQADPRAFARHRIEVQREAFERLDWTVTPIEEEDRKRYALKYTGSHWYFTRGLAPGQAASDATKTSHAAVPRGSALPAASRDRPFNRVSRIWKPTVEYFPDSWAYFVHFIEILKRKGARFLTMSDALEGKYDKSATNVLLDHHIDFYPIETEVMCRWELEHEVISNVYVFNRFDYDDTVQRKKWTVEDLDIPFYQELERRGFEIGYHQNAVGLARAERLKRNYSRTLSDEEIRKAQAIFAEDVDNLSRHFQIRTFIPHGAGEANAQLVELPEGYDHLTWVYNNSRRNKTRKPPLAWRNYSDSCGCSPQRIRSVGAQYIVCMDNLHVNAHLAGSGLNHVLVHPGRYSKGMPYERVGNSESCSDDSVVRNEFEGVDEARLPLRVPELCREWEGVAGARQRELEWKQRPDGYEIPHRLDKYYVLSDDDAVLRNHMARNELAVPFLLVPHDLTPEERERYRVPRPPNNVVPIPVPAPEEAHVNGRSMNRLFREQFRRFINLVFAADVLEHLRAAPIEFDAIHVTDLRLRGRRDVRRLIDVLDRYRGVEQIVLRGGVASGSAPALRRRLARELGRRGVGHAYTVAVTDAADVKRRTGLPCAVDVRASALAREGHAEPLDVARGGSRPRAGWWAWGRRWRRNGTPGGEPTQEQSERLSELARVRGESFEATLERFGWEGVRRAPRRFSKHLPNLLGVEFEDAGVRDGLAYVVLPTGRVFYGHRSKPNHRRAFDYVQDLLSPSLDADTFLLALDVTHRYLSNFMWFPDSILPGPGGTVVEAGAYLGHKTIRFVDDTVGREGRVLAIEMMPDNAQILRRNIAANGLQHCVDVVQAGVWNEDSEIEVKGKGRQRNTLVELRGLEESTDLSVPTRSLDTLLADWAGPVVDLLFISVNGAEIEALQGLDAALERVKVIFVAAPYARDGISNAERCRDLLRAKGCVLLSCCEGNRIAAASPRFARQYA